MKKVSLLFLCAFISPAFATGIGTGTTSAPCDNATLSKYNGTADIEINWEPNTINLTWYDGDTQLNVPVASQTCTYDGMITVPSAPPQKLGYTFNGWKIPKIDFSTIPTNVNGTNRWAIGWRNDEIYCSYGTDINNYNQVPCSSDITYNELQTHEWKTRFTHGDLYGTSVCTTATGSRWGGIGNPAIENGTGQYCWCQATKYKAINTNIINSPTHTLSWVYAKTYTSTANCLTSCSLYCSLRVDSFFSGIFTPAQ